MQQVYNRLVVYPNTCVYLQNRYPYLRRFAISLFGHLEAIPMFSQTQISIVSSWFYGDSQFPSNSHYFLWFLHSFHAISINNHKYRRFQWGYLRTSKLSISVDFPWNTPNILRATPHGHGNLHMPCCFIGPRDVQQVQSQAAQRRGAQLIQPPRDTRISLMVSFGKVSGKVYDYLWLYMVIYVYLWLFVIIYGYLWLFMVIYGYLWLFMVIYG